MRWFGRLVVVAALGLGACEQNYPRPMTAGDVGSFDSGEALVTYLSQRDASPAVCNFRSKGPHITRLDRDAATALIDALQQGKIDLALAQRCIDRALETGSGQVAAALIEAGARADQSLATDPAVETSPAAQAHLATLEAIYVQRPTGKDGDPRVVGAIFDDLRRRFFGGHLGPVAARLTNDLLGVVELEQGRYGGQPVDVARLDWFAARGDETVLQRAADRLPAQALRVEARRRVVRLRIAASPFPEVRSQAAAVEARVMQQGINPVALASQPVVRAWVDGTKLALRDVYVRQDLFRQRAALFGGVPGGGLSVMPNLSLRGALSVQVTGLSRPITICRSPRFYDPTPCLAGDDVAVENPLADPEHDGTFRFRDQVSEDQLVALARSGDSFHISIDAGGHSIVPLARPIRFERPSDLVLVPKTGRGPALQVAVTQPAPSLYLFTVSGERLLYRAVVEKRDLAAFHVVSRGATGASGFDGTSGMDGSSGMDGTSASCPSFGGTDGGRGGDGLAGGDGGPGGNGGDGGDVVVRLDCDAAGCSADDVALFRRVVLSQGGPGGSGGAGGRGGKGGRGGRGGSGTTCVDDATNTSNSLNGGSDGPSGSDGASGTAGSDGAPGRPGLVRIEAAPRPSAGMAF